MKKHCVTAISIICIIAFYVGLPAYANVIQTQSGGSPSGEAIEYNQYVKRVWVVEDGGDHQTNYFQSFHISQIANGEISGEFSLISLSLPNPDYCSSHDVRYWGIFTGTINKYTADCQFSLKTGDTGNIKLVFEPNNRIKATFTYNSKSQKLKDIISNLRDIGSPSVTLHLDGVYQFKPYNLNDISGFIPINDQCFTVDLNSWGTVNFVTGKIKSKRIHDVFYLTNKDGDILYSLGSPFPTNVPVAAVLFQDVNKDGLKDIIIIIDVDESSWHRAKVFFQKGDGSFYLDDGLNREINVSGNNKDIETVTDYISKKF